MKKVFMTWMTLCHRYFLLLRDAHWQWKEESEWCPLSRHLRKTEWQMAHQASRFQLYVHYCRGYEMNKPLATICFILLVCACEAQTMRQRA